MLKIKTDKNFHSIMDGNKVLSVVTGSLKVAETRLGELLPNTNTPAEQEAVEYLHREGFKAKESEKYIKVLKLKDLLAGAGNWDNRVIGKYRILQEKEDEYIAIRKNNQFPFYCKVRKEAI